MKEIELQRIRNQIDGEKERLAIAEGDLNRLYEWATTRRRFSGDTSRITLAERRVVGHRERLAELEATLAEAEADG